jgi:hypothetical protein
MATRTLSGKPAVMRAARCHRSTCSRRRAAIFAQATNSQQPTPTLTPLTRPASNPTPSVQPPSTAWWKTFASEMDTQAMNLARSRAFVHRAAAAEQYAAAARHAAAVSSLVAANSATQIQASLADAVNADDFPRAAALRDAALLRLRGWWRVTAHGSDPWGHLVHVTEGYGRLSARAYSAAHLAELHGWQDDTFFNTEGGAVAVEEGGVPLFEVMLTHTPDGAPQCWLLAEEFSLISALCAALDLVSVAFSCDVPRSGAVRGDKRATASMDVSSALCGHASAQLGAIFSHPPL